MDSSAPGEKKEAFTTYVKGNYAESIMAFKKILERGEDESVLFYLGNAYLSNNNTREAENTFKSYLARFHEFSTEAKWYLSLSYLKQGNRKDAEPLLKELARQDSDYNKEANEILRKW